MKSVLLRGTGEFELPRVRVIGVQLCKEFKDTALARIIIL